MAEPWAQWTPPSCGGSCARAASGWTSPAGWSMSRSWPTPGAWTSTTSGRLSSSAGNRLVQCCLSTSRLSPTGSQMSAGILNWYWCLIVIHKAFLISAGMVEPTDWGLIARAKVLEWRVAEISGTFYCHSHSSTIPQFYNLNTAFTLLHKKSDKYLILVSLVECDRMCQETFPCCGRSPPVTASWWPPPQSSGWLVEL